jgi:hypothetical protein
MPEGSTAQRILECTGRNLAPGEHWQAYGVGFVGRKTASSMPTYPCRACLKNYCAGSSADLTEITDP